jgi:PAS domain S-box-containing protein
MNYPVRQRIANWLWSECVVPLAIASCFVLVALLWTFLLQRVIVYPFVFLFLGAIIGSAWYGGLTAGVISIVESTIFVSYFFIEPFFSFSIAKEYQSFLAAFILIAITIAIVSAARKRSEIMARVARDELEARVQERTAELERSNLEILESERQLRELTEAIPQQIWRANADGCIEYCNHHLIDYLGVSLDEVKGDKFFRMIHPEDEALFRSGWQDALRKQGNFEMEARVRGTEGTYRWFIIRSIPHLNRDGAIACWYGIHIDIEQRRRVQQDLVEAQENLARLTRSMSMAEMAASIAHELNQPLTAVAMHAYACREWLRNQPPNLEKASMTAEKIVQESTRASTVVKRVRALFRKESEIREAANINTLIQDLMQLLRGECIRCGVHLCVYPGSDLQVVEMDTIQVQQIILNLAINAIDAMSQNNDSRELTIRTENAGEGEILVKIEDNGPGIPREVADRMFEPFFSTKPKGIGMGLAICRSIVEAHNGRIWAENSSQGGAIFQFTLRS